jgi:predicted SnoaL-like aldol condensation-catalyzing enzyme
MLLNQRLWPTKLIGLALIACAAGCAQTPAKTADHRSTPPDADLTCSAAQIEHNRQLAKLFRLDGDPDEAYRQMKPDYIQHNPVAFRMGQVNGVKGRDEFKLLMDMKNKGFGGPRPLLPGQPPEETYHFIMATCDYVFLLKKSYPPDPQYPGKFYEAFDFDLWRIQDGKLAEHWDGGRVPERIPEMIQKPFRDMTPPPPPPAK